MSADPRHDLGLVGEELAAEHLGRRGFRILERNYRTRWGELDNRRLRRAGSGLLRGEDRRSGGSGGQRARSSGPRKQAQVRRMAGRWLTERRQRPYANVIRFDCHRGDA